MMLWWVLVNRPKERVFAQARLRVATKNARIIRRLRAIMAGVVARDDNAGEVSSLKDIIHVATQQAGAGQQNHFLK